MRTKLALVSAVVGLFLLGRALPLSAHHAFAAEFDSNKPVKFEGTVTKMQWTNPHEWVYVDVDGYQSKDGSHRANGRDITLADGRTLFLGSTGTGAPYELPTGGQNVKP